MEDGSITDVPGFVAAGVHCGLKKEGMLDLALVLSQRPACCAGVFTTNRFQAAPVLYDRDAIDSDPRGVRAVAINSGCANACTGPEGEEDAREMARLAGRALGVDANRVLVMSTGVIGQRLDLAKVGAGLTRAAESLSSAGGHDAARAIMTTDTRPKEFALRAQVAGATVTVAGMAKGAGMIGPNMATLLSLIVTDASVSPAALEQILVYATNRSFNCITVDGDMSTNDTLLLLANGAAGNPTIEGRESEGFGDLRDAVTTTAVELAKMVAFDGEGATKRVTIQVKGARTWEEGRTAAMSVANSPLVKTAIYGRDANWGRILCAVGYSGVPVDPGRVDLWLGDLHLVRQGRPHDVNEARAAEILAEEDVAITVDLGMGQESVTVWTCDLSHDYVSINAHYRT
ncbi:MAG: bifunctional glutamate N-acetyltransferase/amino-acid acetyltransferase ArgJ [Anaerolineae bacterium]|nr:bifunctional glutamate N-acetyltransferase/amino-acid acetyltransferase ArgJ [Anaerolineae bacterium]